MIEICIIPNEQALHCSATGMENFFYNYRLILNVQKRVFCSVQQCFVPFMLGAYTVYSGLLSWAVYHQFEPTVIQIMLVFNEENKKLWNMETSLKVKHDKTN